MTIGGASKFLLSSHINIKYQSPIYSAAGGGERHCNSCLKATSIVSMLEHLNRHGSYVTCALSNVDFQLVAKEKKLGSYRIKKGASTMVCTIEQVRL